MDPILEYTECIPSILILGINRNNDGILPLETNMASSWLVLREGKTFCGP